MISTLSAAIRNELANSRAKAHPSISFDPEAPTA